MIAGSEVQPCRMTGDDVRWPRMTATTHLNPQL